MPQRRVVTGHDGDGRSIVVSDGPVPVNRTAEDTGLVFHEVWNTAAAPAPIAAQEPEPTTRPLWIAPEGPGSVIRVNEFLPGHVQDGRQTAMHRTESVDYGIVLEGEMTLILTGEEVALEAGDIVVQRGTDHAWANRSERSAKMAFILIGGKFADDLGALRQSGLDDLTDELN